MGAVLFPEIELLQGEKKETKKDFVWYWSNNIAIQEQQVILFQKSIMQSIPD